MARATTAAVTLLSGTREPVRAAADTNIALSGEQTIDGVAVEAGDRVLVMGQTDATTNGIYAVSTGTWRRASDARSPRSLTKGVRIPIQEGTEYGGTDARSLTVEPNLGDDEIEFTVLSGAGVTKADIGLANVDNTSDLAKPISTATQTALDGKSAVGHTHVKADVGLGNVDNTTDALKPISTATQTALDAKAATSHTHATSDITGLEEAVEDYIAGALVAGSNVTVTYDDAAHTITIASSGGGGSLALNDLTDVDTTGAVNGKIIKHNGTSWVVADDATASGASTGAPVDAQYVVLSSNADLTGERILAVSADIVKTDAGAGNTLTLSLAATAVAAGSYGAAGSVGTFTVDGNGRLTAAATVPIVVNDGNWSGADLAITNGGTGASSASAARAALGLGSVDNTSDTDKPVSTAQQTALNAKEPLGEVAGIRTITSSETAVLADKGKVIESNHATNAINYTVPPNSSVAFPVNTRIDLIRYGAGAFAVVAGSGVTVRSSGSALGIGAQYGGATLYKRATDEWVLSGNLA